MKKGLLPILAVVAAVVVGIPLTEVFAQYQYQGQYFNYQPMNQVSYTGSPSIPNNVQVVWSSTNSVQLQWSPSTDYTYPISGYYVYRNGTLIGVTANTYFVDASSSSYLGTVYTVASYDTAGMMSPMSAQAQMFGYFNSFNQSYYNPVYQIQPYQNYTYQQQSYYPQQQVYDPPNYQTSNSYTPGTSGPIRVSLKT